MISVFNDVHGEFLKGFEVVYKYEFDSTRVGDARYDRSEYEVVHGAIFLLESKLKAWNEVALLNGALDPPYAREVKDLHQILEWGQEKLFDDSNSEIHVNGISVGSVRYHKAALIHAAWHHEGETNKNTTSIWPSAVIEATRDKVRRYHKMADEIPYPPAAILEELRAEYGIAKPQAGPEANWDAFISHASEDKDEFVRPLAEALRELGISVWYDEFALTIGDSLRRSIDRGLAHSRFGIVVLSPKFFEKEWPQKELDGLVAREVDGMKVILPIWHRVSATEIRQFSPMLADRVAISSANGLAAVVDALAAAMRQLTRKL